MARKTPEVNASSTADIAFLLLVFFLVTTTMDVDSGIYRKLPPIPEDQDITKAPKSKPRNVLLVRINYTNLLQVGGNQMDISRLKDKVKEFITNPNNDNNLSEKKFKEIPLLGRKAVSKGVVSLQSDVGTSYEMYIKVQDVLATAFVELKDEAAMIQWGKPFADLNEEQQEAIKKLAPTAISEAEPKKMGGK